MLIFLPVTTLLLYIVIILLGVTVYETSILRAIHHFEKNNFLILEHLIKLYQTVGDVCFFFFCSVTALCQL